MKYLSVCSGIEAATVAWHGLGWTPAGFSEIEKFPSQVLAHHYPTMQNYGDMTRYKEWNIDEPIGLLVGGTPCQSFSVAGLRKGLDDPRGNLALVYCGMLDHFRPTWFVWENVPGVLSSSGGRDFGSFLGAVAELGYGFAYRVLDAQFFGVAQRRRRVFVVGYLGDWRPPAAVLFERKSLRRDTAPSRETGEKPAGTVAQCFEPRSPDGHARLIGDFSPTLNRMGGGQREPCVITKTFDFQSSGEYGEAPVAATLSARDYKSAKDLVAQPKPLDPYLGGEVTISIDASYYKGCGGTSTGERPVVASGMAVRRLTPVECERLQGFPDNYTNIKNPTPDGPRYKALGNSMAVPVMRWIGERINATKTLPN